jgi:hypothetical protein
MSEATVEQDPERIDPQDMAAILKILDGIDVGAAPVPATAAGSPEPWTLSVHWLQHGPVSTDTEVALAPALEQIRAEFLGRGRTPPARMQVLGPDGGVLLTVADGGVETGA